MINFFVGEDRIKAKRAIVDYLGKNYEVFDGVDLLEDDLLNICQGNSLFATKRSILIQDLSKNKILFDKVLQYLDTPHNIAVLEQNIDKRSSVYKALKEKKLIREFSLAKNVALNKVFNIYSVAKYDGPKAVEMLESIKDQEDPIMFFGLIVSGALKDFKTKPDLRGKKVLSALSQLDLRIKTNSIDPWLIIESFLVRLQYL